MRNYGLIGTGGFGREVMPAYKRQVENHDLNHKMYFVVEDGYESSDLVMGLDVLNLTQFLSLPGERHFNVAIADHIQRRRIAEICIASEAVPYNIMDRSFRQIGANSIGHGLIACHLSTITADAVIGSFVHLNIYSYVAHDCIVGDFVTFAPSVMCNGNVIIEDGAYIGTGAVIKQGSRSKPIRIGAGAIIGMGAVVTKDVEPQAVVVGNPARPINR